MNNIKHIIEDFIKNVEFKEIENFSDDKLRKAYEIKIKPSDAACLVNSIIIEQLKRSIPQGFRKDDPSFCSEEKINSCAEENVGKHREKKRKDAIIEECLEDFFNQKILQEVGKYHSEPKIQKKSENANELEYIVEFDAFNSDINLDGVSLNLYDYTVEDADVDNEMKELLKSKTNFVESGDASRTANENDLVLLEFVGRTKVAGKDKFIEFTRNKSGGELVNLGEGKMLPEFEKGVIGLKGGEVNNSVSVVFPKEYHNKSVAGLNAIFTITLKKIYDKKDFSSAEEFAEKNKIESADKLKELVTLSLKNRTDAIIKEIKKREFFDELKKIDVDLPSLIVEQEFNSAKINYLNKRVQEGIDELTTDDDKEKKVKDDLEKLMEDVKNQVKLSIVFMDCEKKHNISLEQQDLMIALPNYAQANGMSQEQLVEYLKKNKSALDYFRKNVLEEKILNFTINKLSLNTIQSSIDEIKKTHEKYLNGDK